MKNWKHYFILCFMMFIVFLFFTCDDDKTPKEEKTEKSYLVTNTKVTIKYMGFISDTEIPAEISKLARAFDAPVYSVWDRTIYVIDDSAAVCSIRSNGTMQAGRQWIINTPEEDDILFGAIYNLRMSWTAMNKKNNFIKCI